MVFFAPNKHPSCHTGKSPRSFTTHPNRKLSRSNTAGVKELFYETTFSDSKGIPAGFSCEQIFHRDSS
jgi:hypothetical protein